MQRSESKQPSKRRGRPRKKAEGLGDTIEQNELDTSNMYEIPKYEGYFIDENHNVYSTRGRHGKTAPRKLKIQLQNGYPSVSLYRSDGSNSKNPDVLYLHRLIADAFIPKIEGKNFVNHKDGNKQNNSLDNLEWVTQQENNLHAYQSGLIKKKYSDEQILEVITRVHKKGEMQTSVAKDMGVPISFVNDVVSKGTGIKSSGLGDDIEKLLNSKLMKPITNRVKKILWEDNEDCGCDARKEKLNKIFRYNTPECLTEDEYEAVGKLINKGVIRPDEQKELNTIYNRVFHDKVEMTMCGSCLADRVSRLKKIYDTYADS